jgi:hypothetical protein
MNGVTVPWTTNLSDRFLMLSGRTHVATAVVEGGVQKPAIRDLRTNVKTIIPGARANHGGFSPEFVQPNGSAAAGTVGFSDLNREAFVWTPSGGTKILGKLSPRDATSVAKFVTADGKAAFGTSSHPDRGTKLFHWSEADGMTQVTGFAQAVGLTDDGKTLHGIDDFNRRVTWTKDGGTVVGSWLGDPAAKSADKHSVVSGVGLPGQPYFHHALNNDNYQVDFSIAQPDGSFAYVMTTSGYENEWITGIDATADGKMAAGTIRYTLQDRYGTEAWLWDEVNGYRTLRDALLNDYDFHPDLLDGVYFDSVEGMSSDGRYLVGGAWITNYGNTTYLIDLATPPSGGGAPTPEPSTIVLWVAVLGCGSILTRRRVTI